MNETDIEINKKFRRIGNGRYANIQLKFSNFSSDTDIFFITNETIHQESITLKQSICDADELEFGGCIASELTFEVSEAMNADIKGKKFEFLMQSVEVGNESDYTDFKSLGVFIVDDVQMVDGKDYKKVTAYDMMYDAVKTDVSNWYNNIFPKTTTVKTDENGNEVEEIVYRPVTLKNFRNSLLEYIGIPYNLATLPNDDMAVEKTINVENGLNGQQLLKMISVLQGGFGKINSNGYFEIINLNNGETLEILDICDDFEYSEYIDLKYTEYDCMPITCIKFTTDSEDTGCVVGSDTSNPYLITGNIMLYGKSATELTEIGNNILPNLQFKYKPVTASLKGFPYAHTGHKLLFKNTTNNTNVESYVFARELTGIQSMKDTFTAKGTEYRENKVSPSVMIEQVKAKTLRIEQSIDNVSTEMSDLEKKTKSLIEQTVDSIVLKVDSNGNIVQVALGIDADNGTNYFKVGADNIELTADETINLLAGGDLNLTGKKITITSENFNVAMDGTVSINNGNLYVSNDDIYVSINPSNENVFEVGVKEKIYSGFSTAIEYSDIGIDFKNGMTDGKYMIQSDGSRYLYGVTGLDNDHNIYVFDTSVSYDNWKIFDTINTDKSFETLIRSDVTNKLYYSLCDSESGENYRDLYEYDINTKTSKYILSYLNFFEQFIADGYLYSYNFYSSYNVIDGYNCAIYKLSDGSCNNVLLSTEKCIYQAPMKYNGNYYAVVDCRDGCYIHKINLSDSNIEVGEEISKIIDSSDIPIFNSMAFELAEKYMHIFMFGESDEYEYGFTKHTVYDMESNSIVRNEAYIISEIKNYGSMPEYPPITIATIGNKMHFFFYSSDDYGNKKHLILTDVDGYKRDAKKIFYTTQDGNGVFDGNINASAGKIGGWNIENGWLVGDDGAGITWNRDGYNFGTNGNNLEISKDGIVKVRINTYGNAVDDFGNNCLYADLGCIMLNAGDGGASIAGKNIYLNPKEKAYVNNKEILTTDSIKEKTNLNIKCDSEQKIQTIDVAYSDGTTEKLSVEWDTNNNVTKIGGTEINWEFEGVG